jgi:hypothetical protein
VARCRGRMRSNGNEESCLSTVPPNPGKSQTCTETLQVPGTFPLSRASKPAIIDQQLSLLGAHVDRRMASFPKECRAWFLTVCSLMATKIDQFVDAVFNRPNGKHGEPQ